MADLIAEPQHELTRSLDFKDTVSLVIGSVIGTGVFLKASGMAQEARSALWVLIAWVVAGILSLAGALCYAELGSRFPDAGGEYVFLRQGYGERMAFLYGWSRFWIASPGSIAAFAVGAITFLSGPLHIEGMLRMSLYASGLVVFFSLLNCVSVAFGGWVQSILTALKMLLIIGLSLAICFFSSTGRLQNLEVASGGLWSAIGPFPGWPAFGTMLISALWAYDGWNNMPMAAGEVINPKRNIPLALVVGMIFVIVIYCFTNFSYFYALPLSEAMSGNSTAYPSASPIAALAAATAFGAVVVGFLSFGFALSGIGGLNGAVLANARVPYAMARDKLFFAFLGKLSGQAVPVAAIAAQAVVSIVMALSGTFDQLSDCVVITEWIFYALAVASLFRLRKLEERAAYEVPLFPFVPLLFILAAFLLIGNSLMTLPLPSGVGIGFTLSGLPVYFWLKKKSRRAS